MKNKYYLILPALILGLVSMVFLAACSGTSSATATHLATTSTTQPVTTSLPSSSNSTATAAAQGITLNISAAASLTDALKALDSLYTKNNPNVTITPNFAGSGTLQKQIEQGAPADIFISAASSQMDALQKENLITASTRKNLLTNTLVMIVPNDSTLGLTGLTDLTSTKVTHIAIGDPKSVPCGTYAVAAFDELGITSQISSKYVIGSDVKSVLSYVSSGNADAGFVYATDALTSTSVKVVATAPADINAKIVYPIAVVAATKVSDEAVKFENFLFSTDAGAIFKQYGFTLVSQ